MNRNAVLALIGNLWQNAIAALTKEPEIMMCMIWQIEDRCGCIHWHACDSRTNELVSLASEVEMLSWLENL